MVIIVYRLSNPHIGKEEKECVIKAINANELTYGQYLIDFTASLSSYINQDTIVCSSGSAALHLALKALDIGLGDDVIVPNLSFISTINAIIIAGGNPIVCDVGDASYDFSINPNSIKNCITPNTKAIIVAHLFGSYGNIKKIKTLAKYHKISLIEDAAQSLGCFYKGKALGTFGDIGIFSFNGNKIITTGGGGAITSSNKKILKRIANMINQSKNPLNPYDHTELGFNYRLSNIHAAIGYAQIQKLPQFIYNKQRIFNLYNKKLNIIKPKKQSNYWHIIYKTKIPAIQLHRKLKTNGIESRPIYLPFNQIKFLKIDGNFPISNHLYKNNLCIPSDITLSKKDVNYIINYIIKQDK